jgi:hypothetical protein
MSVETIRRIEREYENWKEWHCKKKACDHNLCRFRSAKMCELRIKLAIQIDECRARGIDIRLRDTLKPLGRRG